MSDIQPSIDDILASIRARVTGAGAPDAPAPDISTRPVVEVAEAVSVAMPELGAVELPEPGAGTTLDDLIRSLLTPMLKAWLDAHLPEIVERTAQAEIRRLTGRD